MLIIANPMQRYLAMINLQQSLWKLFLCQKQKATPTDILILQVGRVICVYACSRWCKKTEEAQKSSNFYASQTRLHWNLNKMFKEVISLTKKIKWTQIYIITWKFILVCMRWMNLMQRLYSKNSFDWNYKLGMNEFEAEIAYL